MTDHERQLVIHTLTSFAGIIEVMATELGVSAPLGLVSTRDRLRLLVEHVEADTLTPALRVEVVKSIEGYAGTLADLGLMHPQSQTWQITLQAFRHLIEAVQGFPYVLGPSAPPDATSADSTDSSKSSSGTTSDGSDVPETMDPSTTVEAPPKLLKP